MFLILLIKYKAEKKKLVRGFKRFDFNFLQKIYNLKQEVVLTKVRCHFENI